VSRTAGRRPRLAGRAGTVLLGLAAAGLLLLATTRPWLVADLPPGPAGGSGTSLDVPGSTAAALVPALGLVGLAGAVALSTLRGAGRALAALLLALAGVAACAATAAVLADPGAAAAAAVRSATGVAGAGASTARATPWALAALAPALGLSAVGASALRHGRRWGTSARFEAPAAPPAGAATGAPAGAPSRAPSRAALWDDLSAGEDPTTGPGAR
jgi:uncharacterized membrane protein (TIGR02234 family)